MSSVVYPQSRLSFHSHPSNQPEIDFESNSSTDSESGVQNLPKRKKAYVDRGIRAFSKIRHPQLQILDVLKNVALSQTYTDINKVRGVKWESVSNSDDDRTYQESFFFPYHNPKQEIPEDSHRRIREHLNNKEMTVREICSKARNIKRPKTNNSFPRISFRPPYGAVSSSSDNLKTQSLLLGRASPMPSLSPLRKHNVNSCPDKQMNIIKSTRIEEIAEEVLSIYRNGDSSAILSKILKLYPLNALYLDSFRIEKYIETVSKTTLQVDSKVDISQRVIFQLVTSFRLGEDYKKSINDFNGFVVESLRNLIKSHLKLPISQRIKTALKELQQKEDTQLQQFYVIIRNMGYQEAVLTLQNAQKLLANHKSGFLDTLDPVEVEMLKIFSEITCDISQISLKRFCSSFIMPILSIKKNYIDQIFQTHWRNIRSDYEERFQTNEREVLREILSILFSDDFTCYFAGSFTELFINRRLSFQVQSSATCDTQVQASLMKFLDKQAVSIMNMLLMRDSKERRNKILLDAYYFLDQALREQDIDRFEGVLFFSQELMRLIKVQSRDKRFDLFNDLQGMYQDLFGEKEPLIKEWIKTERNEMIKDRVKNSIEELRFLSNPV